MHTVLGIQSNIPADTILLLQLLYFSQKVLEHADPDVPLILHVLFLLQFLKHFLIVDVRKLTVVTHQNDPFAGLCH